MGTKLRKYPYETKKQIVELFLEGHSAKDLAEQYDIRNSRRVTEWVNKARGSGFEALEDSRGAHSKGKKRKEEKSLEEENERLQLEVEYLKKLLDLKRG